MKSVTKLSAIGAQHGALSLLKQYAAREALSSKTRHIDEMRIKIKREIFWLWRLIDSDGAEIEMLLQKRRNAKAAIRFLKRILKMVGILPRVMITDKLRSYKKAHRMLCKSVEHCSHKRLNNRIENTHQPTLEKERQMRSFKKPGNTQKFLSSMGVFLNLLKVNRYKYSAQDYKQKLKMAFATFDEIVSLHHPYA